MRVTAILAALVAFEIAVVGIAHTATYSKPSLHSAKVATFKGLLHVTEQRPDAIDATQAAITVRGCRRIVGGWRCRGVLDGVSISGLVGITCTYVIHVYRHKTELSSGDC